MKITMVRVTVSDPIEMEIPDGCPECGAHFLDATGASRSLCEEQLRLTEQDVALVAGKLNRGGIDYLDGSPHVVGYRCECGHQLASTEGGAA